MAINFISSKDFDETCIMRTKSDNTEIIMGDETDNITKELFESPFAKTSGRIRRKNEKRK